jgi:hypothetical protein
MAPAPLPDETQASLSHASARLSIEDVYESRPLTDLDGGISRHSLLPNAGEVDAMPQDVDVMPPGVDVAPPVASDEEDATVALILALQENMASGDQTRRETAPLIGVSRSQLSKWMSCSLGYRSELEVNRQVSVYLGLAPAASVGTNDAPNSLGVWPDCLRASHASGSHADHVQRVTLVNAIQALLRYDGLRHMIWQDLNVIEAITLVAPVFEVYRRVTVPTIGTALGYRLWYHGKKADALNRAVIELNNNESYRTVATRSSILSGVLREIGSSEGLSPDQVLIKLTDEAKGVSSAAEWLEAWPASSTDETPSSLELVELVGRWT